MITAIILAAGQSKRMGQPKMLLPWGRSTVLQTIISTFHAAGLRDILVVTGAGHHQIEDLVGKAVQTIYNAGYESGGMLSSIQVGLAYKLQESEAAIIALGDQPQIEMRTISRLLQVSRETSRSLVVPSHDNHRGHPWLVGSQYWSEILAMRPPATMRNFFKKHENEIHYVAVEDPSVLVDLDTPDDYMKYHPE